MEKVKAFFTQEVDTLKAEIRQKDQIHQQQTQSNQKQIQSLQSTIQAQALKLEALEGKLATALQQLQRYAEKENVKEVAQQKILKE